MIPNQELFDRLFELTKDEPISDATRALVDVARSSGETHRSLLNTLLVNPTTLQDIQKWGEATMSDFDPDTCCVTRDPLRPVRSWPVNLVSEEWQAYYRKCELEFMARQRVAGYSVLSLIAYVADADQLLPAEACEPAVVTRLNIRWRLLGFEVGLPRPNDAPQLVRLYFDPANCPVNQRGAQAVTDRQVIRLDGDELKPQLAVVLDDFAACFPECRREWIVIPWRAGAAHDPNRT